MRDRPRQDEIHAVQKLVVEAIGRNSLHEAYLGRAQVQVPCLLRASASDPRARDDGKGYGFPGQFACSPASSLRDASSGKTLRPAAATHRRAVERGAAAAEDVLATLAPAWGTPQHASDGRGPALKALPMAQIALASCRARPPASGRGMRPAKGMGTMRATGAEQPMQASDAATSSLMARATNL